MTFAIKNENMISNNNLLLHTELYFKFLNIKQFM